MRTASDRGLAAVSMPGRKGGGVAWFRSLALAFGIGLANAPVAAATVFACEPEWAAIVQELLPQARVHVATHARQDPHHVEARPALIAQLRSADLAVCTGAGLEAGWLPALQQRAANPRVQVGQPGMFHAADHVRLIDPKPATLSPFAGDVHPEGNPHLHADPRRIAEVAEALSERIGQIWPAHAAEVALRHAAWAERWEGHMQRWRLQAEALKGRRIAGQHTTFGYLWHWLEMEMVADLEPRPGMPPTPGHLDSLRAAMLTNPPAAIVLAAYQDDRPARWLIQQLGGTSSLLVLPASVDDPGQPGALERWFDQLLSELVSAVGAR